MEFELSRDDGEVATKEQIVSTTKEVTKTHSRNRKKRRKVFAHVVDYLDGIIPAAYEMHKNYLLDNLVEWMEELTQLFVEVLKLLIPLLDQGNQKDNLKYELSTFSNVLESFLLHLQKWCSDQNDNSQGKSLLTFIDLTFSFLVKIVNLAAETDSWRYVDVINIPVTFILVEWGKAPKNRALERFTNWTNITFSSVIILEKRVVQCGDFACQYFVMILIQQWITWAGAGRAEDFLSQSFPTVNMKTRRSLLESEDFDLSARTFLNAVNSSTKGPRTKMITSVKCLYFFAEDEHITPPEDCGQLWIDFSASSRRIHSFFATRNNPWVNLSIDSEQIDSICVSWLRRNDGKSQFLTQTQSQALTQDSSTQKSMASTLETGCLIFLHIRLKNCFSEISNDLDEFQDQNIRSLTLCFQDIGVIERVLHQMSLPTHANDHKHCSRPDKLMKFLEIDTPIPPPSCSKSPCRRPSTPRPFSRVLFPASPIIPGRPSTPFRHSLSPSDTCPPTPCSLKTAAVQQRNDEQNIEFDMDQEIMPASPIIPGRPSTPFRHSLSPNSTCPPTPCSLKTAVQQRNDEQNIEFDMDQEIMPASPIVPGRPSTPFRHSLSPSSTCPPTPCTLKTAVQQRYDKDDLELDMDQEIIPASPIIPWRHFTPRRTIRHSLSPTSTCPPTPCSLKTTVQQRYDEDDIELDMDQGVLPASPIIPWRTSTPRPTFRHLLSPSSTCPPTPCSLTTAVQQRYDKEDVELGMDQGMMPASPIIPERSSTPHPTFLLSPSSTCPPTPWSLKRATIEHRYDAEDIELDMDQEIIPASPIIPRRPSTFCRHSPPPLTQFVDPYDITKEVDFFKEKKMKKYSRKTKSAPVSRARAPRCHAITASDEELDRLIAELPEKAPTTKKNKSRQAKKETKAGTSRSPKVKLPRKKPTVIKPIKPPKNKLPTNKQCKPKRAKKNQPPLEESVPKSGSPFKESVQKSRSPFKESVQKSRSHPKSRSPLEESVPQSGSPFKESVQKSRSPFEASDLKGRSPLKESIPKRRSSVEESVPKRKMSLDERVKKSKSPFQTRRSKSPPPSLLNKTFDWENMDFEYEKVVERQKKKSSLFLHDQQRETHKGTPPPDVDSDDSFDWENMDTLLDNL